MSYQVDIVDERAIGEMLAFIEARRRRLMEAGDFRWTICGPVSSILRRLGQEKNQWQLQVCRQDDSIAGIAIFSQSFSYCDYWIAVETDEIDVIRTVIAPLPPGSILYLAGIDRQEIVDQLLTLPENSIESAYDLFTTSKQTFQPMSGEPVTEIGEADIDAVFSETEIAKLGESLKGKRKRIFVILRNGKAASTASYGVPEPERGYEPTASITDVYTVEAHRRQGMCSRLISEITILTLESGQKPIYFARRENTAIQALLARLGFLEYGSLTNVILRKSGAGTRWDSLDA
ncbi:MAG: GNAT family N-acetyltransferase [Armatimonadota bacterium]